MATIALQKKMNNQMNELQIKSDVHVRQMIMERKRLDDLDDALKQADDQIKNFRMSTKATAVELLNQHRFTSKPANIRADGADPSKQAEISQKKLISSLEHRLDKLRIRLSQTENHNEQLKTQINQLRRHRMTSDKCREQIEFAIKETQKKVRSVLDKSQEVSESRELIIEQLNELHRAQADDREKFVEQMQSLAEYIDKQNREFEESIAAAAAASTTREDETEFFITRGNLTLEEEKLKAELVCEIETQLQTEKELMEQTENKIKLYKQSFDELRRVSGISDITEIIQQYVKSEEETFSLFNYVQAQNQETDWTLERHARLEEEIKTYEEELSIEETQRAEAMANLQGKWRNAKEATDECSHAAQEAQRTLGRIAKKVQSLFFKIQCEQMMSASARDSGKSRKMSGQKSSGIGRPDNKLALLSGQGVTESNILAYAELIEKRALEIMSDYTRRMNRQENSNMATVLDPSKCLGGVSQSDVVKPPEIDGDDDEAEDDDGRPIALDEMRRRTAEMLAKKQQASKLASKRQTVSRQGMGIRTASKSS
ncbi:hypothetical protein CTAYLR_010722 [Chrysophaeum taylorii]|uniref:ODAD1 central coiled coil region domain-containing protein n=1 Tax=Chrysophaeum taylorii TaxID=2483200 RepID=A0AAD7XJS2_9STRA|nr:hypothetical protein CTAYLR_010722 [Chrysophaeum taylorii]